MQPVMLPDLCWKEGAAAAAAAELSANGGRSMWARTCGRTRTRREPASFAGSFGVFGRHDTDAGFDIFYYYYFCTLLVRLRAPEPTTAA